VRVGCREFKRIGDKPQLNLTPSDFGFWQSMRTREALSASRDSSPVQPVNRLSLMPSSSTSVLSGRRFVRYFLCH
jgi:hypothetical protein